MTKRSTQTNPLIEIILSSDDTVRNRSLESVCSGASMQQLLDHIDALDAFRRTESNLYHRVRALFFLAAIYRYHLPKCLPPTSSGLIPHAGYEHLLSRRFLEAIDTFLETQRSDGPSDALASSLAQAYHQLGFQTLADQVRRSVRSVRGNQWMFRLGHPADHPLRVHHDLMKIDPVTGTAPLLKETTAVRMDFSHSAWSDIFFLGMDFPEGARVLNVSIDLGVRGRDDRPKPPIETYLRIIDRPVIRLTSVDLGASTEVETISEMFDFGRDYLGLLKAAVIASGVVPPGLEGCRQTIPELLARIAGPGRGIELVSKINDIPKGSRLAVSTNLLGSLISILMRATGQIESLTGPLTETDRRLVAARAILGEWIGGSGGGWQDSGGVWPGIKLICGSTAGPGDPEYGVSRGRLMPVHHVMGDDEASPETRQKIQDSLVLVHGGMAQNVGPILEMVTEHYLLRSEQEWRGRAEAMKILDEVTDAIREGDVQRIGEVTTRNFEGPLQTIIPWATNRFTDSLIQQCRDRYADQFWGFWMLGGMAGGGMGFIFDPAIKSEAQDWLADAMVSTKRELQTALPFAMDPVVYDFAINDNGTFAEMLTGNDAVMPDRYYALLLPQLLRTPMRDLPPGRRIEMEQIGRRCHDTTGNETARLLLGSVLPQDQKSNDPSQSLPQVLVDAGFDRQQHELIREDLRSGRIGLAQNRLPAATTIRDVQPDHVIDVRQGSDQKYVDLGTRAIRDGKIGVVTLAAGVGSRWTEGAGVCKALHPFNRFAGRHRSFLEAHLAKNRMTTATHGGSIPHVFTTSHLTDEPIREHLRRHQNFGFDSGVHVSTGRSVGLRMIPTVRDLRFLWEETAQQVLDEQQQKVRESVRQALVGWATQSGPCNDYTDNVPSQCIHPVGHWFEVPNMLRNGLLSQVLGQQPELEYLLLHNIDTLGASVDPGLLGRHIDGQQTLSFEVIGRRLEDRGGGLALVDGRPRLVEGLAMPTEKTEFDLTFYNSMTTWIHIDGLLSTFGLTRSDLANRVKVDDAVRQMATRLPTYVTLKDVKKRWGHAQEDIYPVAQFEKLWGDMTSLPEIDCKFFVTPMRRGQQLKSQAQLDPWKRDGSADYIDSICKWS
ncbi:UTP--glucose-1-phosphate uridylyltransferase [Rubripirellula lacrimiformis]|uniref:UTP--glucose-1-phosphate uridylyltransferase n=1 Tax=Rubripirellula lacrimiformis TaxID=1930273 RepID=A0A517N3C2_9BACT|nr:UTP--glucose-1-phosphate uridylyltransferase [Rubripirellula lacrimiformis]QDT01642.1 UTP--glucose-1-phosphate uridylyltransferase [Rubripirellula lacrimiformis]